jgi:predicted transcriptional regulator
MAVSIDRNALVLMTRDIVVAEISHNAVPPEAVPGLIERVYEALQRIALTGSRSTALQAEASALARNGSSRPAARKPEPQGTADDQADPYGLQEASAAWLGQDEAAPPAIRPQAATARAEGREPAVPREARVYTDYIVCLFDGVRRKMLKRHVKTRYGMSPEEYRRYWELPEDYPMTAPAYSEEKSNYAVTTGFGRSRRRS